MEVTGTRDGDVVVCVLKGRLDASTSPEVDTNLKNLLGGDAKYLLGDLAQLDYISSAGLRILLMRAKELSGRGGKLVLYSLKPEVRQVFDIAGFSKIIPIFDGKEKALAGLGL
ncbi:MAG: STAS domain-containing protein [Deltaproteobacteria bacterium]|nr:STAS domain-containing protein [Deltaproteobacteria bacterium]